MTFQETHVSDNTLSIINTQFQARYSLWIRRCGIVSFSPSFIFSDNLAPKNDRMIFTKVKHPYNAFVTFWLLVLYVPATSGRQRQQFFDQVLHLLHNQDLDINFDRLFITGDFNYSYLRPKLSSQTSIQWVSFLEDHFYNALMIFMAFLLLGRMTLLTLQLTISLSIKHFVLKLLKATYIG
ncbi:hypothetical protein RO3G_13803 [Rhizopus delemar RA 99-880]|uniref:Endonuclease/exonuclease/phosphatase domain-containing protein n=1 Tax=Rhizopus delemar (strain RA 99-880 / ATCC MYA-4621 / FGSC 9543 / NRRL 43880) TaxID=246409 RepID=I1CKW2_RHIO9|nr:hypothetical protein RO3G_13803 [Rhizopus delemar RA 99-880]|eukprot:EIE89092.1 hypothetical protein RO3G_13803 [Rhizopus delemar RA 99-880]